MITSVWDLIPLVCESSSCVGEDQWLVQVVLGTFFVVCQLLSVCFSAPSSPLSTLGVVKAEIVPPASGSVRHCQQGCARAIARPEEEEGTGFFLSASSSKEGPLSNPALLQWQQFLPVAAAESISQFFRYIQDRLSCTRWGADTPPKPPTQRSMAELLPFVPQPGTAALSAGH